VREIFVCGRARPQRATERYVRTAFGGQLVPTHRPHAIAYLAGSERGRKPTTSEKIRTLDADEQSLTKVPLEPGFENLRGRAFDVVLDALE